ncbi:flavodoxin domain-containing protein [Lentzea sp. NPDC055074]
MTDVLVAYATKMGSTREIAEAIGERLRSAGHEVTVLDAARVRSVERHDALVLGSGLYAGRWRREAVKLLKRNEELLVDRPTWLFHDGPLGKEITPQPAPRKVREIAARIGSEEPATFGGRLTAQTAVGFIAKKMAQGDMAGDFRDFDEIRAWADRVAGQLAGSSPVPPAGA